MSYNKTVKIIVEGKADEKFLTDLVKFRFPHQPITKETFFRTGGWTKLCEPDTLNEITRTLDDGGDVLVIFDADTNHTQRKKELINLLSSNNIHLNANNIFLLPNDNSSGNLESLLLHVATRELHRGFFDCFDKFEECLKSYKTVCSEPVATPGGKECIFTYLDIHCQKSKEDERNYRDSVYWNLCHPALNRLVDFLRPYFP